MKIKRAITNFLNRSWVSFFLMASITLLSCLSIVAVMLIMLIVIMNKAYGYA